jgi:transcriptional regulator with XRE-family HTH domain
MTASMWRRDDIRLALAHHDIGAVFRLMQRYGYSQRAIAALTGMHQGEVCDVIAGRRLIGAYAILDRIVDGFGIPRGWVGLAFDDESAALRSIPIPSGSTVPLQWPVGWNPGRPTARYGNEARNARRRTERLLNA